MNRRYSRSYAAQIRPSKCIIAEEESTGQGQKHVIREATRLFIQRCRIELSFCFPPAGSKQPCAQPRLSLVRGFAWRGVLVVISACNISQVSPATARIYLVSSVTEIGLSTPSFHTPSRTPLPTPSCVLRRRGDIMLSPQR